MRKTKGKNDSFWQIGMLPFVALWASTYAVAWFGLMTLIEWIEDIANSSQEQNFIAIAFITLVAAFLQVQVVERLLKRSMRGWMLYSFVGTVLTFLTFRDSSGSNNIQMMITALSLLFPTPLIQTIWLWKRVKSAWLWPLASIVASLMFAMPLSTGEGAEVGVIIGAILYGLVQGGIMRYLWMQPKEDEKAKVNLAAEAALSERTDRLQEAEETAAPWLYTDDQNAQRRAR